MAARSRRGGGRARARLIAGIGLLGLALLAQPPLAQAAFPGANGKIAFDSQRSPGFDFEIYSMNSDGTGPTDLTNNPEDDFAPAWSPGGQKIAFYSFRDGAAEVWTMNADGSGQTGLTTQAASPNSQPAWSPDGQKIVFVSGRDGNDEIYVMNANGTGQTRLTNNLAADEEPAFSPSGLKIVFVSDRDGNREVYSMNADGSGQTRLTNNAAADYGPNWSPNGLQILFTSQRDGNAEIYRMSSSGGAQTRLTTDPAWDEQPVFSPDGTRIAFETQRDGCCAPEIYSMLASGSGPINLTQDPGDDGNPDWQSLPSGQIVVKLDSQPNDPQDFSFTAGGGLSPSSFTLDDDSDPTLSNTQTYATVPSHAGYSLSESVPPGWDLSSATCDDGSPVTNIDVAPGETVTCTFTNRKHGTIVAVEDAQPNDPQDFSFTAGGGLSPSSFTLDDDSDPTLSNTRTFNDVSSGSGYSLSQTVPSGWDQTGATCDDGSPISNIDVAPGETVTCTFTNRKRGKIIAIKDAQPNDAQNFSFAAGGGLSPSSFTLDDDSDPTLSNTQTFTNVVPGSGYSLSETVPPGWDQSGATCDDGSPTSNINVSAGETVTCTFTNLKSGSIVVVEDSQPNDPQDFSFTAGGGLNPSSFSLDDDSDPTLSNTRTFSGVPAGSGYSLAETLPSGWKRAAASCDDGSPASNIDVAPGETVTCTFVNSKVFYDTPAAASTLSASIVPEFRQTISSTQCSARSGQPSAHGAPLALSSCNPPELAPGTQAHLGTQASGLAQLGAVPGNPTTPADEADLSLSASLTDLHALSRTGADYNPNPSGADITLIFKLRIDDLYNGGSLSSPGTVADTTFATPVDCVTTPDPSVGSTCSASTSANAVTPGSIREGKQTILQVFRLRLNDSGANGVRGDSDDRSFAMQGFYVP